MLFSCMPTARHSVFISHVNVTATLSGLWEGGGGGGVKYARKTAHRSIVFDKIVVSILVC